MKDGMAFPYRNPRLSPRKKFRSGQVSAGLAGSLERIENLRETFPFSLAHPPFDARDGNFPRRSFGKLVDGDRPTRDESSPCARKRGRKGRAAFPAAPALAALPDQRSAPRLSLPESADAASGRAHFPLFPRARAAKELDEGEKFP